MVKFLNPILILLVGILPCAAQEDASLRAVKCGLTMNESPRLQGYRLGMDISEVDPNQIVGKAGDKEETYIKVVDSGAIIYLTFEINKLKTITVLYKSIKFTGVDAFVEYLNKTLELPVYWTRQTPKQKEIETQIAELEEKLSTVIALRNLMFQIHGRRCRQAKRMEREIPKLVKSESRLQEQRQIGSRLNCAGFSISAFIDNSIDREVPAVHLFIPEASKRLRKHPK